jgi:hypothetical protein
MSAFHKTIWAKVEAGDTVLITHADGEIIEVNVNEAYMRKTDDGKDLVFIHYRYGYAKYAVTVEPNETAYVQSRM